MRVLLLFIMLLAGQGAAGQSVSREGREVMVLDLTGPRRQEPMSSGPFRARSLAHVGRERHGVPGGPPVWPIRTTLLGITPTTDPGQWIVEVRLEALDEVQLPCSLDRKKVDPDPSAPLPSYRHMFFALEEAGVPPLEAKRALGDGSRVSGSDLARGSLVTLKPGDSVRVRFRARVGELIRRERPDAPIAVRARVFTAAGAYAAPKLQSTNVLEVRPTSAR